MSSHGTISKIIIIIYAHVIIILLVFRTEKYRPQLLKDVVGNEEIVSRLEVIGKTGNMPNLMLSVLT